MQIFSFTPQETRALIFLVTALLVGSGVTLYKRMHPGSAPELTVEKRQVGLQHEEETSAARAQTVTRINLNRATCAELEVLPGVGPALSRRIVDYREAKGPFKRIEDIMQVRGIGPQTFEQMKDHLTVE